MGQGSATILLWGVPVPEDVASKVYDEIYQDSSVHEDEDCWYDALSKEEVEEINRFRRDLNDQEFSDRLLCKMFADDADGAVDDTTYDPGSMHYVGVFLASKGYGGNDDIAYWQDKMRNDSVFSSKVNDIWGKCIVPVLKSFGHQDLNPSFQILTQMW